MGYSKLQFAMAAFSEIGIASYQFDVSSPEIGEAVNRLDAMLADWIAQGIPLRYPIDDPSYTDWSMQTNVQDWAWRAVITNLAIEIAPGYGKAVSQQTLTTARNAKNTLFARRCPIPQLQLPAMPAGAGNKPWRWYGGVIQYTGDFE